MNWIPKKTLYIFSWAILFLCATLYFGGLFIVMSKIKSIESYYSDTESRSGREERVRVIKNLAESNKSNIQALRGFFIQKGDEAKFIEKIEAVGKNSGAKFEISSIDVDANQPKSFKEDVSIKVAIEGSWQQVSDFIDKIQKMDFGVAIEDLSLDAKSASIWRGSLGLTVFRER